MSIIVLSACMAAVVLSAVLIGYSFGTASAATVEAPVAAFALQNEPSVSTPAPTQETPQATAQGVTSGLIAVPGFERLTAEGNTLRAVGVSNPAANACYFVVTFILPDGAEVYRSSYLAPGQSLGDVTLSKPLAVGSYEGTIARYSCFDLATMRPLNGADITFTLEVLS